MANGATRIDFKSIVMVVYKKRNCKYCKKIFEVRNYHLYYCSAECRRKNHKKNALSYYYKYSKKRRLKLRFEIFKRDKFTCQYCGRKAPNIELQIDHIYPKIKGGENKKSNYNTSCIECNVGKKDVLLSDSIK